MSYLSYLQNLDSKGRKYAVITNTESFFKNKGYFKHLFKEFSKQMVKNKVEYLNFEICEDNIIAKNILEKLGFYHLTDISDFGYGLDTLCMRKHL